MRYYSWNLYRILFFMVYKIGLALLFLISVNITFMMLVVFSIITVLLCVSDIIA